MELVDDLGGASHREVDGILDVTAPASAIDTLELSPAVASVTPVPRRGGPSRPTLAGTGETRFGLGGGGPGLSRYRLLCIDEFGDDLATSLMAVTFLRSRLPR